MYPLDLDHTGGDETDGQSDTWAIAPGSKTELPKPLQALIQLIFDVQAMQEAMKEFELDMQKMPLGKLSKKQMLEAYSVLKELSKAVKQYTRRVNGAEKKKKAGKDDDDEIDAAQARAHHVLQSATNRFYTLIPHDHGIHVPPLISTDAQVAAKIEMLDAMMDIEIAYKLIESSREQVAADGRDPLDANYEKLRCELEPAMPDDDDWAMVSTYVKNTHGATHAGYKLKVKALFRTVRSGERETFAAHKNLTNRKLLWHGSRTTNYVGILSQGLRIAPPEAPPTGYMFGKGVYFADSVSKSANYCHAELTTTSAIGKGANTGLLLLCEVALGKMDERRSADPSLPTSLPSDCQSVVGLGRNRPDERKSIRIDDDAVEVPLGKLREHGGTKRTDLEYNEYIVYDTAQIRVRYLVQLEFKASYHY